MGTALGVAIFFLVVWVVKCINILNEWEKAVVLRLGRVLAADKGPGLILIFWPIDRMYRISLQIET